MIWFAEIESKLQANMSGEFRGDSIEWFDYFDLHLAEDIAELKKEIQGGREGRMKKQILVVYKWKNETGSGFGNVNFTVDFNVPTIEDIREIERQICKSYYFDNVVVLNIIELGESEDTE